MRCIGILRQTVFDGFDTLSIICGCAPVELVKRGECEIADLCVRMFAPLSNDKSLSQCSRTCGYQPL
jgi:hypothetical protein